MKESGKVAFERGRVSCFGLTAPPTKAIGWTTTPPALASSSTKAATSMKATGDETEPTARVSIKAKTAAFTEESGLMTSSTARALKCGRTAPSMRATTAAA